jgi:glycosyltransferase involved in cell wall biosynthesis
VRKKREIVPAATELTLVVPVFNEEQAIGRLLEEIVSAVGSSPGAVEILVIDDGSTDTTPQILADFARRCPVLRIITFEQNAGQSAAMVCGFKEATGRYVVALDGDGQSDPRDIPRLAALLESYDVVCGIRRQRRDSLSKRWGSRFANFARRLVTKDTVVDIGCSLKAFRRDPLQRICFFDGCHRFLPVMLELEGCSITQIEVNHRPRWGGRSKYGNWGRLLRTWQDLLGVRWLQKRKLRYRIKGSDQAMGPYQTKGPA